MSTLNKEIFSNNENSQEDLSLDNPTNSKAKNVKIYDDDDAYMLNFEKDNGDENEVREDVSDLDNYEKINKDKPNMNFSEEIDDQEPRKEFNSAKINAEKKDKKNENNLAENIKKGNIYSNNILRIWTKWDGIRK